VWEARPNRDSSSKGPGHHMWIGRLRKKELMDALYSRDLAIACKRVVEVCSGTSKRELNGKESEIMMVLAGFP